MKGCGRKLVIGDKNLSSWSMRAWLAAVQSALPFEEVLVTLDRPDTAAELSRWSPSKRVPCLIDNGLAIWDSMAICEYFAERAPHQHLWPSDANERALARSMAAEMHSGFGALRGQLSMDLRLRIQVRHLTDATCADIRRILELWDIALTRQPRQPGPFLFGPFGIVDAFYTPVVFRFNSYGVDVRSERLRGYMHAIQNHPPVQEWLAAALKEPGQGYSF